jgi:hypothetical protein
MRGVVCGKVSGAARDLPAVQPSRSDDPCKASERIGLDTSDRKFRLPDGVLMPLMP